MSKPQQRVSVKKTSSNRAGAVPSVADSQSASGVAKAPACTLVIFGAGGDLTKRLLMPSLYNLSASRLLDDKFAVLGVDHSAGTDQGWRKAMTTMLKSFSKDRTAEFYTSHLDMQAWDWVSERLSYVSADFEDDETYRQLAGRIKGNAIFYLAVAARFFGPISERLGKAGLLKQDGTNFRRLVIEKPFGNDVASARELNQRILSVAAEEQVYRIDHFLGKDTVQSIMAVRFGNSIYEPLWRREFIDHVQISVAETIGVEQRGAFYESTGALRDMVPNHVFQLLAMTAMEPPNSFDAEAIRDEKAKLVDALQPVLPENVVRGQYGPGALDGELVAGYRKEPGVSPRSPVETYVAMKLFIENWRWAGVPFYLRTGKRMADRRTEISVHFKPAPYRLFRDTPVDRITPNVFTLLIDPTHGTTLDFNVKVPGPVMDIGRVHSSFQYHDFFTEKPNVGYETLLYDCMLGDATLFQRADTIEASWAIVQPALDTAADNPAQRYPAGSAGPADADELLARDGRHWRSLERADDAGAIAQANARADGKAVPKTRNGSAARSAAAGERAGTVKAGAAKAAAGKMPKLAGKKSKASAKTVTRAAAKATVGAAKAVSTAKRKATKQKGRKHADKQ
jgi:glucose-6-phosphate 1-dehydrogenase